MALQLIPLLAGLSAAYRTFKLGKILKKINDARILFNKSKKVKDASKLIKGGKRFDFKTGKGKPLNSKDEKLMKALNFTVGAVGPGLALAQLYKEVKKNPEEAKALGIFGLVLSRFKKVQQAGKATADFWNKLSITDRLGTIAGIDTLLVALKKLDQPNKKEIKEQLTQLKAKLVKINHEEKQREKKKTDTVKKREQFKLHKELFRHLDDQTRPLPRRRQKLLKNRAKPVPKISDPIKLDTTEIPKIEPIKATNSDVKQAPKVLGSRKLIATKNPQIKPPTIIKDGGIKPAPQIHVPKKLDTAEILKIEPTKISKSRIDLAPKTPGPRKPVKTIISPVKRSKIESREIEQMPQISEPRELGNTNISPVQRAKIESSGVKPASKIPGPRKLATTKFFPSQRETINDRETSRRSDLPDPINLSLITNTKPDIIMTLENPYKGVSNGTSQLPSYFNPDQEAGYYNNSNQLSNSATNVNNFGGINVNINSAGTDLDPSTIGQDIAIETQKALRSSLSDNAPGLVSA